MFVCGAKMHGLNLEIGAKPCSPFPKKSHHLVKGRGVGKAFNLLGEPHATTTVMESRHNLTQNELCKRLRIKRLGTSSVHHRNS